MAYTINTPTNSTGNVLMSVAVNPNYSVAGSNGYTWTNTATSAGQWTTAPMTVNQTGTIELAGKNADIIINGKSISDALTAIESRLAILRPATELEAEWEELKRLGDEYRALEKEIQEKVKTWDILKK